jgi:uncharacterized protein
MNLLKFLLVILVVAAVGAGTYYFAYQRKAASQISPNISQDQTEDKGESIEQLPHPLSIEALRKGEYPGSQLEIEQELAPGSNYQRYITSYKSDGLKIFALLTVPNGPKPANGWPVVVFNHGYIPPSEYATTERYVAYQDAFARNGYITIKSDYRGHGNSEGQGSTYGSNGYTIDVLNAVSTIKKHPDADPNRIGMWGHSMGGHITLRNMVTNKDIKAAVIWAGVVASYPDMLNNWRRRSPMPSMLPGNNTLGSSRGWRNSFVLEYGEPEQNPQFWNSISANAYLSDIAGPVQLHHGTADHSVPVAFSEKLDQELKAKGKQSELFIYPGDDHNLANNLGLALQRSVDFFDKYVKGE